MVWFRPKNWKLQKLSSDNIGVHRETPGCAMHLKHSDNQQTFLKRDRHGKEGQDTWWQPMVVLQQHCMEHMQNIHNYDAWCSVLLHSMSSVATCNHAGARRVYHRQDQCFRLGWAWFKQTCTLSQRKTGFKAFNRENKPIFLLVAFLQRIFEMASDCFASSSDGSAVLCMFIAVEKKELFWANSICH